MQYKSMSLSLIQENLELYEQLRSSKRLLPAMDAYAVDLKAGHEAWKDQLGRTRPGSDPSQIASEALEIALKDLEDSLPSGSLPDEDEAISIEEAMAFFLRHTPPA